MFVVFDAMGTLLDLAPLERRIGSKLALEAWFERTLHGATSLTLAGGFAPFKDIARAALATTVARLEIDVGVDVDVDDVMDGFRELEPFPDAADAVAHAPNGAVLTNGSAKDTQELLRRGGINKHVIGVEEVRAYEPHPAPYRLTAEQLGDRILLVSAHAWDVLGGPCKEDREVSATASEEPRRRPRSASCTICDSAAVIALRRLRSCCGVHNKNGRIWDRATIKNAAGTTFSSGSWTVDGVLGFVSYGNGTPQGTPPDLSGGQAKLHVSLAGAGVLTVTCLLGSPPGGADEGITLILAGGWNFRKSVEARPSSSPRRRSRVERGSESFSRPVASSQSGL